MWLGRAGLTFQAIVRADLYNRRRALFGTRRVSIWHFDHAWPFSCAWSAIETLSELPGQDAARVVSAGMAKSVGCYRRRLGAPGFGSAVRALPGATSEVFYDDNAWIGLAALLHFRHSLQAVHLAIAEEALALVLTGWSGAAGWASPGGIRWKLAEASETRNTCSNAPTVELAALAYRHTGSDRWLEWAERIYAWTKGTLRGGDGLYHDRITPSGHVDPSVWSYNQGTMIGAGVLLYRLTGNRLYLDDATATAQASMAQFTTQRLLAEEAAFPAIYLRNLLLFAEFVPDPACRRIAAEFGEYAWTCIRESDTGLFRGQGSPVSRTAPMIEVFSLLAGARPHP